MTEEWLPVKNYESYYEISNHGRIKSYRKIRPFIMKQATHYKGYKYLYLQIGGRKNRQKFFVHRLVACAFIPNPDSKPIVNHMDCDKGNNKLSNLEWMSDQENTSYYHLTKGTKFTDDIPF